MKEIIELQIGESTFKCEVEFDFTEGCAAKTCGLPEDCYPAEDDEYDVYSLGISEDDGVWVDISVLIEAFVGDIEEALEVIRDESREYYEEDD